MAAYTFECAGCQQRITVEHSLRDPHPATHAGCGGALIRVFEPSPVIFRGSGFYSRDKALYGHTPGDYERDDYVG